jgi:uncharacterized protein (DUF1330 family)
MPKAYVLVEMAVTDPEALEAYKPLAAKAVDEYGGRYLARGGPVELLEGVGLPSRVTLIEFPDLAAATTWYASPEYGEARAARAGATTARFVAVEGLE